MNIIATIKDPKVGNVSMIFSDTDEIKRILDWIRSKNCTISDVVFSILNEKSI